MQRRIVNGEEYAGLLEQVLTRGGAELTHSAAERINELRTQFKHLMFNVANLPAEIDVIRRGLARVVQENYLLRRAYSDPDADIGLHSARGIE